MSNDALTWAFALRMTDASAKSVLIALADHADDDWRCWPAVERLCLFTAFSERAVRYAVGRLIDMGAILRAHRPGTSDTFTLVKDWSGQAEPRHDVHPGKKSTPATDAPLPRQEVHLTPATDAPHPGTSCTLTLNNPQEPPPEPSIGGRHERPAKRRTQLSTDWQPDAAQRQYAIDQGLDPDTTAENFRDYWLGKGEPMADWNRTWQRWCRSPYNRPRPAGGGQRANGGGIAQGGGGVVAAAQRVRLRRMGFQG